MSQNFVIGNKTKIYFTILPDSLLDNPAEPSDVVLTTSAIVAQNATSIPVTALTGPIPRGTPLNFTKAGSPDVKVYTTASAVAGATSITVEPVSASIASGSQANYKALLLLIGGTNADESIQNNDTETKVFGEELGFGTGVVTSATWSINYQCNVLPADDGYFRLAYAARYAADGVLGWLRKEDQAPRGYTKGESIAGVVAVTNFSKTTGADAIITASMDLTGRGAPVIGHYS